MKLFKKRQKESIMEQYNKASTLNDIIQREELIEEYSKLNELFKTDSSEDIRLRMVEISEHLSPKIKKEEKISSSFFKKKKKYEEKYCHICKHNIALHHKKGRSTGCRKCGCLRTVEEIMNPSDNGHDNSIVKIDISEEELQSGT